MPLELAVPERTPPERPPTLACGIDEGARCDEQTALGSCQSLQPLRHVDGISDDGVLHHAATPDDAGKYFAVVETDADFEHAGRGGLDRNGPPTQIGEDRKRRAQGPVGIVGLGFGGSEYGEDAVADELVDGAPMREDVLDDTLPKYGKKLADLAGIELFRDGGEAANIYEHDCDDLTRATAIHRIMIVG